MKTITLQLLLAICLPFAVLSKNPESLPEYSVGKTEAIKTLAKNESIFKLIFYSGGIPLKGKKIKMSHNGKEQTISCDKQGVFALKVKPGKYVFQFYYTKNHFEIITDSIHIKGGFQTPVHVYFTSSIEPVMAEKPVIYMYAPDTTDVTLKISTKEKLSFTYPVYNDGWKVKATPSGNLVAGKSVFPYLFWEGNIHLQANEINTSEGYVISKENMITFFEEKLSAMGLTPKEQADFITYWCPRMSANEAVYIHFVFNTEMDKYAALNIAPKPDNLFRVFMVWAPFEDQVFYRELKEQKIPSVKRNGFTVVEWGGTEITSPEIMK